MVKIAECLLRCNEKCLSSKLNDKLFEFCTKENGDEKRRNKKNSPKLKIEYSYPHIHHHQLVDICFSASPNASRCALICSTRSITNGWLNLPFVESKNSWCFFGHSSRFSYSNACKTMSRRSKSLTNFDSGVWFSSYSYNKCRKYFLLHTQDCMISECICECKHYVRIVLFIQNLGICWEVLSALEI